MSDAMKSILFAVILCITCSLLLTAATNGLKDYKQQNIQLDKRKNILKSVGLLSVDNPLEAAEVNALYSKSIDPIEIAPPAASQDTGTTGENTVKKLPIYLYRLPTKEIRAYVIPIDTRGLWGKIKGYMAIKSDGSTISGFTVYKHSETPGLGGEIETNWFQKNFVGKRITDLGGNFVSIGIAKGNVADTIPEKKQINYVDGISGATLTGKFLTSGFKDVLSEYEPVSLHFRQTTHKELFESQKQTK